MNPATASVSPKTTKAAVPAPKGASEVVPIEVVAEDEATPESTAAARASAVVKLELTTAVKALQAPKASKRVLNSPADELATLLPTAAEPSSRVAELESALAVVQG